MARKVVYAISFRSYISFTRVSKAKLGILRDNTIGKTSPLMNNLSGKPPRIRINRQEK